MWIDSDFKWLIFEQNDHWLISNVDWKKMFDYKAVKCTFYLCEEGYVLSGIFLSFICLLATSCKVCWSDFHENFISDVPLEKEFSNKFWRSSASGSGPADI